MPLLLLVALMVLVLGLRWPSEIDRVEVEMAEVRDDNGRPHVGRVLGNTTNGASQSTSTSSRPAAASAAATAAATAAASLR